MFPSPQPALFAWVKKIENEACDQVQRLIDIKVGGVVQNRHQDVNIPTLPQSYLDLSAQSYLDLSQSFQFLSILGPARRLRGPWPQSFQFLSILVPVSRHSPNHANTRREAPRPPAAIFLAPPGGSTGSGCNAVSLHFRSFKILT